MQRKRILGLAALPVLGVVAIAAFSWIGSAAPVSAATGPSRVELVTPKGTPITTLNGGLGTVSVTPNVQEASVTAAFNSGLDTTDWPLFEKIPASTRIGVTSVTVTCTTCTPAQSGYHSITATIYAGNSSTCPYTVEPNATNVIAVLVASQDTPTVEFTYPTPRVAPHGFTPTGLWCIGLRISSTDNDTAYVTVNGAPA